MKQLLREIVSVILGILIALGVNNWNEERKEKKYLNQIQSSIQKELQESVEEIKASIPKQEVLINNLGRYLNDESKSIFEIMSASNGLQKPSIKNNSWRAIANSKIELIEFQKLSDLSEIDQSKEDLELKTEKLVDYLILHLKSTEREHKEVFMLLSQEILSTTKIAQSEIEEFLNKP